MSIFGIFKKNNNNEETNTTVFEGETNSINEDGLDLTDNIQKNVTIQNEDQADASAEITDQSDSNNENKQLDPNVDKVSGHNNNDVQYFMDKNTDLSSIVSRLAQRFENAGYDVNVNHVDDKDDQYYNLEAIKTEESSSPIFIEVNNELAGAVKNINDHIESTAFDPTNEEEITNILMAWSN